MKRYLVSLLLVAGSISSANAQYGCGTPYTAPCQVQIQPQQNLGQQMFNIANSFDPAGAFRKADTDYQNYQLQQQEIEIRRLELEKRKRQLQQQ
jgi:hypothetical protein